MGWEWISAVRGGGSGLFRGEDVTREVEGGSAGVDAAEGNVGEVGVCEGAVQSVRHFRKRSCCLGVIDSDSDGIVLKADRWRRRKTFVASTSVARCRLR